jgi:RNA polymerase sigma-70 factor (ECF subfamily)
MPEQREPTSIESAGSFVTTHWSVVQSAGHGTTLARQAALEKLCRSYWYPLYAYVRRRGYSPEDAQDLTQSFFATTLEHDFFARFDPAKASFRTYLRMAAERFAAREHQAAHRQKRGGDVKFEPLEEQCASTETPEQIFEREWQRQLLALALDDLRVHCESRGKQLHFQIFEAYDLCSAARPSYQELAALHSIAETSVTNHLAWARRMLRELALERLRGVTSGERELRYEMRRLWT